MHHVYNKVTGVFNGSALHTDNVTVNMQDLVKANFGEQFAGFPSEQIKDHKQQRVDVATGKLVDYVPPPPTPAQTRAGNVRARLMRRTALAEEERDLVRRLALNPQDPCRGRLREIDNELNAASGDDPVG